MSAADVSSQPIGFLRLAAMSADSPATLTVALNDGGETLLPLAEDTGQREQYEGIAASAWTVSRTSRVADSPSTVTLDNIVDLYGGRLPIGLNPQQHPGPFSADWSIHCSTRVWIADGVLLDANSRSNDMLTLSGSGLQTPRTLIINNAGNQSPACHWQVDEAYRNQAIAALNLVAAAREERQFWAVGLPAALVFAAILLIASATRILIRLCRAAKAVTADSNPPCGRNADNPDNKGATHAEH